MPSLAFPQDSNDLLAEFDNIDIFLEVEESEEDISELEAFSSNDEALNAISLRGRFVQKLIYGMTAPGSVFLRDKSGIDNVKSNINIEAKKKILDDISLKASGDILWEWGQFENGKYKYNPQSAEFNLRDFYLDYFFKNGIWVRVGNQIIARGELNLINATDVVNPRDLSTIGLQELEDIRLQVPALLINYSLGTISQEIILVSEAPSNKLGTLGSSFDPLAAFGSASVVSSISLPENKVEAILRNKFVGNGYELALSFGEFNADSASVITSSVSGSTTTYNSEFDRVSFIGVSGNMAWENFVFKLDTAHKIGNRFSYLNPITAPWAKHENTEFGFGFDYTGWADLTVSLETGFSYIHNYSESLSRKRNEDGFNVRVDWRQLNDLLLISASHSKLVGNNGTFSSIASTYDINDDLSLSGKIVTYDSSLSTQGLYPYRNQDLLEIKFDYSF
jgi:hypothetical protein